MDCSIKWYLDKQQTFSTCVILKNTFVEATPKRLFQNHPTTGCLKAANKQSFSRLQLAKKSLSIVQSSVYSVQSSVFRLNLFNLFCSTFFSNLFN